MPCPVTVDGNTIGSIGASIGGLAIGREADGADLRIARRWTASIAWS